MRHSIFYIFLLSLCMVALGSCARSEKDKPTQEIATSADQIPGHKVACIRGSLQDLMLTQFEGVEVVRLGTAAELLLALEQGTADYVMMDSLFIIGSRNEERNIFCCFTMELCSGNAGFGFRKTDVELCNRMNYFMDSIRQRGICDEMRRRWVCEGADKALMPYIKRYDTGKPIRVATMPDVPFSFVQNREWVGYEMEMMYRFGEYMHRPIQVVDMQFGAMVPALNSGKVDIIASFMYITPERQKSVLFSDPYFYCTNACFYHDNGRPVNKGSFIERLKWSFYANLVEEQRWMLLVDGLCATLFITILSILFGSILGAGLCWLRMRKGKFAQQTARVYVELMLGIPVLVILMIMFYVVFGSSAIEPVWVAVIAFSLVFAAFSSETFRTGISSVDRGQTEAGLAMGFTKNQTFIRFVMPQALKKIIPVFKAQAVSLLKETSVVGYIAIGDLTEASDVIRSRTFDAFFPLILVSIIYFILAWLMAKGLEHIIKDKKKA